MQNVLTLDPLLRVVAFGLLYFAALTAPALQAQGLAASFNAATDIPVTAASYTAIGEVSFTLGFAPTPGTNLTVVKNTGLPFINGQFSNLANGATVNLTHNGTTYPFVAWYYGGDGNNDLVLLWPYTGLAAWGAGKLGFRDVPAEPVPIRIEHSGVLAGKTIVQVATGFTHSLALCSDGTVAAWGEAVGGRLGVLPPYGFFQSVPIAVSRAVGFSALAGKTVVAVAAGGEHSLALCSDGTVVAWGRSFEGQLGTDIGHLPGAPVAVNVESGQSALFGKSVVGISAGFTHSLALCSDGTLAAWGSNDRGEIGNNTGGLGLNQRVPAAVNMASGVSALANKTVVAVSAGDEHSLALCSDGTVAAWGSNSGGVLGNESPNQSFVPIAVNAASGMSALFGKSVVAIAAADDHSLALCSDGTVATWGINSHGQLGTNGTQTQHSYYPVAVHMGAGTSALSGKNVVMIAAGAWHSLALCSDGTLAAWGNNNNNQLGDNSTTDRRAPVAVNVSEGVSALAGRKVTRLGVGYSSFNNLAIYGAEPPEITVEALDPTATFLTNNGSTVDFGSAAVSVRTFRVSNSGDAPLAPLTATLTGEDAADFTVANPPAGGVRSGEASTFQVAFTARSPGLKNASLDISSNDQDEPLFRIPISGTKPLTVSASFAGPFDLPMSSPAIDLTGTQVNLALNFAPEPGTNLTVIKNTGLGMTIGQFSNLENGQTVLLPYNGRNYHFVAWYFGGEGHNDLMLLWAHTGIAAWRSNTYGQLGDNSTTDRASPVDVFKSGVLSEKTIVQVAHGQNHSLALCSDGTVAAWGSNAGGQLGNSTSESQFVTVPIAVNVESGLSALAGKTVIAISAGEYSSFALCSDGTVAAWGDNSSGQLGDNTTIMRRMPTAVYVGPGSTLAGQKVVAITAGLRHTLALRSDGKVAVWGNNTAGQYGNGSQTSSPRPVSPSTYDLGGYPYNPLSSMSVVAIAAGEFHSLALCSDGTIATWGNNGYGQLGTNSTQGNPYPTAVHVDAGTSALSGKTAVKISSGNHHCLALCSDGTLAAWGNNNGLLGDNTTTQRNAPVTVNAEAGVSALAGKSVIAISSGNFALCQDSTLAQWGGSSLVPVISNATSGASVLAGQKIIALSQGLPSSHMMAIYGQAAVSDISVTGNGAAISQNDTTPSAMDLTDFGTVALVQGHTTHAFTIAHQGNEQLTLTGTPLISLSGVGANAFKVIQPPASSLPLGGSTSFVITFDPKSPGEHTATLTIQSNALNHRDFSFTIRGIGALSADLTQSITFAPPATVYLGQNPLSLRAYTSSGLPVTLSVLANGTTAPGASIVGNVLSFTGTGIVKVQATQAGDGLYGAAPVVVKTITVKADPLPLTLLNLAQIYSGTPREISTLGGSGVVKVEYKIGATFGNTAPTNAGTYAVRATDSSGTKTGTLVIAKAPLFVTPDDQTKFVGQDNPPLTLRYSGWVNGESVSLVTAAPILKTTATKTSVGGVYAITASGGAVSPNYAFVYQQGALVVDSFAASYEALLTNNSGRLMGKLSITVAAANTSFTGKLECTDDKALALKGSLLPSPITGSATGSATATSGVIPYDVSLTIQIDGSLTASINRAGAAYASGTGRRLLTLLSGRSVLYSGTHTAALEPATPAGSAVPAGAGWATAAISTKGVMTLAGRLGDGTSFTSTLMPDDATDPTYRLFLQPYKAGAATRLQSHFGGPFTLLPLPTLAGRRYVESAALTWVKQGLSTDVSYRAGFGTVIPLSTVLMLDPWLPPAAAKGSTPAASLATRLGLTSSSFQVQHSATGSTLNGNLPTRVGLSTTNTVSVTTPAANTTKWKATLVPATGLFSGSFELADTTPKPRAVPFTGVLRQPATAPDTLIGDGQYLLPPLTGTEKTTGEVMFLRP